MVKGFLKAYLSGRTLFQLLERCVCFSDRFIPIYKLSSNELSILDVDIYFCNKDSKVVSTFDVNRV